MEAEFITERGLITVLCAIIAVAMIWIIPAALELAQRRRNRP